MEIDLRKLSLDQVTFIIDEVVSPSELAWARKNDHQFKLLAAPFRAKLEFPGSMNDLTMASIFE